MSEHIIEIPDYTSPFDPVARTVSLGERIVRCGDCKGFRTPEYRLKKKLVAYMLGIEIRES